MADGEPVELPDELVEGDLVDVLEWEGLGDAEAVAVGEPVDVTEVVEEAVADFVAVGEAD